MPFALSIWSPKLQIWKYLILKMNSPNLKFWTPVAPHRYTQVKMLGGQSFLPTIKLRYLPYRIIEFIKIPTNDLQCQFTLNFVK